MACSGETAMAGQRYSRCSATGRSAWLDQLADDGFELIAQLQQPPIAALLLSDDPIVSTTSAGSGPI